MHLPMRLIELPQYKGPEELRPLTHYTYIRARISLAGERTREVVRASERAPEQMPANEADLRALEAALQAELPEMSVTVMGFGSMRYDTCKAPPEVVVYGFEKDPNVRNTLGNLSRNLRPCKVTKLKLKKPA